MLDFQKTLKVTWFGIKNSKVFFILMLLMCCVIIPAFIYLSLSEYHPKLQTVEMSVVGMIAAYAGGIFAPIMLFSFLHNRTEQDFYSSMPVKKIQYFFGYFLSGFLMFIIPYTLMFIIFGFIPNEGLWQGYLMPVGMYFVLFCSLTLCMMFCTSKAGAAVTYVLRNGLAASLVILPFTLANLDTDSYFELLSDKILMLTPLGTGVSLFRDYEHILFVQLCIALAELVLSYFLFIKRKNEVTLALAFPKTRYFYQYIVMTVAALYITTIFTAIFDVGHAYSNDMWSYVIFFSVVFSFAVFILLNIIMEKNSKAAFHKIHHFFIFLVSFAVITALTVNLLISLVPYSVLPFSPKFAVVTIYNTEVCKNGNDDYRHFSVFVYDSRDSDSVLCHAVYNKSFIVADEKKLNALVGMAQDSSRSNLRKDLFLFSSHSSWGYNDLSFNDEVPGDLMAVEITFYNANVSFAEEITQDALDELTNQFYLSGTYSQSTRYGFGFGEEYISGFADVIVK